jgi:hypothetical protein
MRIPYISLLAAGALALGGCAYGTYGNPYGYGYGYGPSTSLSIGIGYGGGYYGGYGYGGYGYGYDPFGWYGDYYYPGTGVYVYDSYRRPHVWSDSQRSYWTSRRNQWQSHHTTSTVTQNWSSFDRHSGSHHRTR